MIRTVVVALLAGLATGVFGLVIACVACLAIAFATRGEVTLPGVFHAEFVTIDGAPQLGFLPDWGGMAVALAAWTALAGLLGVLAAHRAHDRQIRTEEQPGAEE
ncbi:MAG: hypothetical protein QM598_08605 [Protaetiibacter sp.]